MRLSEKEKFAKEVIERNHRCRFSKKERWFIISHKNTAIGERSLINCSICDKEFDITDYEMW